VLGEQPFALIGLLLREVSLSVHAHLVAGLSASGSGRREPLRSN
jgi:hypothetical protein